MRNISLFSKPQLDNQSQSKTFGEYLFDTFNWLYEYSPINFSTITGIYHPSMCRLTGNLFLGRTLDITNSKEGLAGEVEIMANLAKQDPKGRAYSSAGAQPSLLLTRPEDIAQVMIHNADKIDKNQVIEVFSAIFGKDNLFTLSPNEKWHAKRKQLLEWVFNSDSLTALVPQVKEILDEYIAKMPKDDTYIASLETFLVSLTMNVFARTRLGAILIVDDDAAKISAGFGKALEVSLEPVNAIWIKLDAILKYVGLHLGPDFANDKNELNKVLTENFFTPNQTSLKERASLLQDYFENAETDIDAAMQNAFEDTGHLLLAGHVTTSRLIQFTLILLSHHKDVLEKLRAEIKEHYPTDGEWTYEQLSSMSYLDKIIKETLRLYPPIPVLARLVTTPLVLGDIPMCPTKELYENKMQTRDVTKDVVLQPNTAIYISPWITHRQASLYEKPLEFNPDRFTSNSIDSNVNCSWIPFGVGSRNCPGRRFALLESKMFLINLLERYDFVVGCENGNLLDISMRGALKHKADVQLKLIPRDDTEKRTFKCQ